MNPIKLTTKLYVTCERLKTYIHVRIVRNTFIRLTAFIIKPVARTLFSLKNKKQIVSLTAFWLRRTRYSRDGKRFRRAVETRVGCGGGDVLAFCRTSSFRRCPKFISRTSHPPATTKTADVDATLIRFVRHRVPGYVYRVLRGCSIRLSNASISVL